jgi:hypothetical protein
LSLSSVRLLATWSPMKDKFLIAAGGLIALALSGCGKTAGSSGQTPAPTPMALTVPQILQQLQAAGQLPTLDVTTTVAGTDSDKNGVRDDIDKFIAALPDTAGQKKALTQMAAAVESTMVVDTTNAVALSTTSMGLNQGTACVFQMYTANAAAKAYLMEELTVNTPIRLHAYQLYNYARNGSTATMATGSVCN